MRSLIVIACVLVGAGLATAATAGLRYFTRYSMHDSLAGEIDPTLYLRLTSMTPFEKGAIVVGAVMVLIGLVLAVACALGPRRPARG